MAEGPGARRLFHLAPRAAWDAHWASGADAWRPPSLEREGFVHLSFADQLRGTLATHHAGARELALVELDPARVADALRLEPSRGGARFPHLFRPLRRADVLRASELERGPDGWGPLPSDPARSG